MSFLGEAVQARGAGGGGDRGTSASPGKLFVGGTWADGGCVGQRERLVGHKRLLSVLV